MNRNSPIIGGQAYNWIWPEEYFNHIVLNVRTWEHETCGIEENDQEPNMLARLARSVGEFLDPLPLFEYDVRAFVTSE